MSAESSNPEPTSRSDLLTDQSRDYSVSSSTSSLGLAASIGAAALGATVGIPVAAAVGVGAAAFAAYGLVRSESARRRTDSIRDIVRDEIDSLDGKERPVALRLLRTLVHASDHTLSDVSTIQSDDVELTRNVVKRLVANGLVHEKVRGGSPRLTMHGWLVPIVRDVLDDPDS